MRLCLNGRDANERIEVGLLEILGDSGDKCGIVCTLGIDIGNCSVRRERIISDMGALRRFKDQLQSCYDLLEGKATYSMLWEDELQFSVSMTRNGHAMICEEFFITIVQNTRKRYDLSIIHIVS